MATEIGIVKALIGIATATAADGVQRKLIIGDKIFADDMITTGVASAIEIEFFDGSLMDLGRNSQALLDHDFFDPEQLLSTEINDEVATLQEALIDGDDPTQEGEPTSSGFKSINGNEGITTVIVEHSAPLGEVTSGFDAPGTGGSLLNSNNLFDGGSNVIDAVDSESGVGSLTVSTQTGFDSDVISYDLSSNFNGNSLKFSVSGLPAGLTLNPLTGIISGALDSSASQDGPYNVTVTGTDSKGGNSVSESFVWNIENPAPNAVNDNEILNEDDVFQGNVKGNDFDPDGDALTYSLNSPASHGVLTFNVDGSYIYTPAPDYHGVDSFTYTITDADGATDTATVSLTVNPVEDSTVTIADTGSTGEGVTLTVAAGSGGVLDNDSDADGGLVVATFTVTGVPGVAHTAGDTVTIDDVGDLTLNADGSYEFVPAANYSGAVPVTTYTTNTGSVDTLTLHVTPIADAPTLIMSITNQQSIVGGSNFITNGSFENVGHTDASGNPLLGDLTGSSLMRAYSIPGWDVTDNALPRMEVHASAHAKVGTTDGQHYNELGATPGNSTIVQQVSGLTDGATYQLSLDYRDKAAMQESGQNGEDSGILEVIWNGAIIATIQGNNRVAWETISLNVVAGSGDGTNSLTLNEVGDSDDSWGIAFDNIQLHASTSYQYEITLDTSLTDIDGSETLSGITIEGLPINTSITTAANGDGTYNAGIVTILADHQLTPAEINAITGSVTSTETVGGSASTTTTNVKVNVVGAGDDALLEGSAGNDILTGGTGDDLFVGGTGNDSLTGNGGSDVFIWNGSDVGTAVTPTHDTVTDFNQADDVLNLADLLSDGSHTIEGITTGTGDLQLNIKDGAGDVVQEIELHGVSTAGTTAAQLLDELLTSGALNDGI